MNLTLQRRLASQILKCAPEKVKFNTEKLADLKESITKADVKSMIAKGAITVKATAESSRGRIRKVQAQKKKGLRKGLGSRKGTANARSNEKEVWMNKIRKQRDFLKQLRDKSKITPAIYQKLFRKAKGGYFRSQRHLKLYMEEHNLFA